jgi:hypothetical protein
MYRTTLTLTAVLVLSSLIGGRPSFASEAMQTKLLSSNETEQEREALRQLGGTLAAGGETWRSFPRANAEYNAGKYPADFTIPDMDCSVDRIADYLSCYGSQIASKEKAERRFTALVDELQVVLPSERWCGAETEPRVGSTRSWTYRAQDSDAQIDIDIATNGSSDEEISYIVTIFGWTTFEPRL